MFAPRRLSVPVLAAILACDLSACSLFESCNSASCAEDAKLTEAVQAQIDARRSLAFHQLYVEVVDHVAYLNGMVDTELERQSAGRIASKVPGVTGVINKLMLLGNRN